MKLDYSKAYIKNGNAIKAVDVEKLLIDGKPLGEILDDVKKLRQAYEQLTDELKGHHIVKRDANYIIEIDGELKRIADLKLHEERDTKLPLNFYKVENGNIVVNKKKVGSL